MSLMRLTRTKSLSSQLRPDLRFIRTLQSPHHLVLDGLTGQYRISSKAFGPSSSDNKLSGDLEQILLQDGLEPTAMYPAVRAAVGAASLTIKQIIDNGASVEHDPVWTNWYHGSVSGTKKQKVREKLRKAAAELIPIDQAEAERLDKALSTEPGSTPT
jgi:hypothetical protein